jgi:hypothetical protein
LGWAQNSQNSTDLETPVCLLIPADDHLIGCVLATKFREDRKEATDGSGRNGSSLSRPRGVDLSKARIELRRASDSAALPCPSQCAAA